MDLSILYGIIIGMRKRLFGRAEYSIDTSKACKKKRKEMKHEAEVRMSKKEARLHTDE
jgi:hypothetical protein